MPMCSEDSYQIQVDNYGSESCNPVDSTFQRGNMQSLHHFLTTCKVLKVLLVQEYHFVFSFCFNSFIEIYFTYGIAHLKYTIQFLKIIFRGVQLPPKQNIFLFKMKLHTHQETFCILIPTPSSWLWQPIIYFLSQQSCVF